MKCRTCGGNVEWTGNMEGPFQTKCDNCGAIDNQVFEDEETPKEQKMSDISDLKTENDRVHRVANKYMDKLRVSQNKNNILDNKNISLEVEVERLSAENDELKKAQEWYITVVPMDTSVDVFISSTGEMISNCYINKSGNIFKDVGENRVHPWIQDATHWRYKQEPPK